MGKSSGDEPLADMANMNKGKISSCAEQYDEFRDYIKRKGVEEVRASASSKPVKIA
jgi:hypothetical protein